MTNCVSKRQRICPRLLGWLLNCHFSVSNPLIHILFLILGMGVCKSFFWFAAWLNLQCGLLEGDCKWEEIEGTYSFPSAVVFCFSSVLFSWLPSPWAPPQRCSLSLQQQVVPKATAGSSVEAVPIPAQPALRASWLPLFRDLEPLPPRTHLLSQSSGTQRHLNITPSSEVSTLWGLSSRLLTVNNSNFFPLLLQT